MTSRRHFLSQAATTSGLMFRTCALQTSSQAQVQVQVQVQASHKHPKMGSKRPPVMHNGKQAKVQDVHAHCYFQDALNPMDAEAKPLLPPMKGVPEHFIHSSDRPAVAERLAAMDAMGIDSQVLSVNPYWYRKEKDLSAEIVHLNNERLAEV